MVLTEARQNWKLKFTAGSITDDSTPGASICLYQGGRLVDSDYEPLSKPDPVQITDRQPSSITLILPPSKTGRTDRLRVEYRPVRTDLFPCVGKWRYLETRDNGEDCVISGLERDTQFQIRHVAVDRVGVGEFSDITVTETVSGSGPGHPIVLSADRNSDSLSWCSQAEAGEAVEGRPVLCYRLEDR
ncbi:unnamed protein product [Coregonus sp. 'balchen']|nr:unnamed protein product [Coregonus sp. 'balchen']